MVEPITLGMIVAALVAKALDRAEDEAVDRGAGVMRRAVGTLRGWFSRENDKDGQRALERLENVPDSPKLARALADLLDDRISRSPELHAELKALENDARDAGVDIGSVTQVAIGDANVQIAGVKDSQVNVGQGFTPRSNG